MVEPACGRIGRGNLRHRQANDQRKRTADEPADNRGKRAASGVAHLEGGDAPGQNADDGERHGKVGEPAHPARKLLRVAHLMEGRGICRENILFALVRHFFAPKNSQRYSLNIPDRALLTAQYNLPWR
jgi:hypothetical protein